MQVFKAKQDMKDWCMPRRPAELPSAHACGSSATDLPREELKPDLFPIWGCLLSGTPPELHADFVCFQGHCE